MAGVLKHHKADCRAVKAPLHDPTSMWSLSGQKKTTQDISDVRNMTEISSMCVSWPSSFGPLCLLVAPGGPALARSLFVTNQWIAFTVGSDTSFRSRCRPLNPHSVALVVPSSKTCRTSLFHFGILFKSFLPLFDLQLVNMLQTIQPSLVSKSCMTFHDQKVDSLKHLFIVLLAPFCICILYSCGKPVTKYCNVSWRNFR